VWACQSSASIRDLAISTHVEILDITARFEFLEDWFRRTLSVSHLCQRDHRCIWIRPVLHLLVKTSQTSRILTHVYDFACRRKTGRRSTGD
jgi:hypothetical protein